MFKPTSHWLDGVFCVPAVCSEHRMSTSPRLPPIGCLNNDLNSSRTLFRNSPRELTREVTVIDPGELPPFLPSLHLCDAELTSGQGSYSSAHLDKRRKQHDELTVRSLRPQSTWLFLFVFFEHNGATSFVHTLYTVSGGVFVRGFWLAKPVCRSEDGERSISPERYYCLQDVGQDFLVSCFSFPSARGYDNDRCDDYVKTGAALSPLRSKA